MNQNVAAKVGVIKIADDVVSAIAGLAATDVQGVKSLAGGITHDRIILSGEKNLSKGVRIAIHDNTVAIKFALILDGSESIPVVTENIMGKTKAAIESMTGLEVVDIQVNFVGVSL